MGEREGLGSGKDHETGLELGSPGGQERHMLEH